jgi:glycogen debranching enzyme
LAKIARVIGLPQEAEMWKQRAAAMVERMIRIMWDDRAGFFWARKDGRPIKVRTPFNLFPLLTGSMPAEIASRLVAHLVDERQFWPRFPVPTVALDDPKYDPNQMWRGPTWVNINYLLIQGLQQTGYQDVARELRRRTLGLICEQDDVYEYYHPETGSNPPKAACIFGWSSAIFIDLAIEASREDGRPAEKPR